MFLLGIDSRPDDDFLLGGWLFYRQIVAEWVQTEQDSGEIRSSLLLRMHHIDLRKRESVYFR